MCVAYGGLRIARLYHCGSSGAGRRPAHSRPRRPRERSCRSAWSGGSQSRFDMQQLRKRPDGAAPLGGLLPARVCSLWLRILKHEPARAVPARARPVDAAPRGMGPRRPCSWRREVVGLRCQWISRPAAGRHLLRAQPRRRLRRCLRRVDQRWHSTRLAHPVTHDGGRVGVEPGGAVEPPTRARASRVRPDNHRLRGRGRVRPPLRRRGHHRGRVPRHHRLAAHHPDPRGRRPPRPFRG
mmetsp:Transcript_15059/g.48724  ORF Transcript_15059/g.48724 Transcript_15059/m.48724 type:complete len:239 (+) Transcript_15059:1-717(+)